MRLNSDELPAYFDNTVRPLSRTYTKIKGDIGSQRMHEGRKKFRTRQAKNE